MPQYPKIQLRRGKEESLLRHHPWVFSGAIASAPQDLEEGDIVEVTAHDGTSLGIGHWQIGSIAVRMLSRQVEEIGRDYFMRRISRALALRQALGLVAPPVSDTYRLVHGEGDFLPGLIVDVYGPTAVMQAHSPGMHYSRHTIASVLTALPGAGITSVYYKSETTLPYKARLDPVNDYIAGHGDTDLACENGLRFHVDWLKGQKTGFFIDQRDNRALLERYARGRRVLNMFCYTGGFSCYALRGGAEQVVSVDSSAKAISITDANVALNFSGDTAARHTSEAVDAFRYLAQMPSGAFDLIVLDPPAFAKHRGALANALQGYRRLNAAAIAKAAPGSLLFTFSCSQAVSREQFRLSVFSAAARTGRKVRILHQLTQPADHPVNIYHPEGEYLKGLILYIQ